MENCFEIGLAFEIVERSEIAKLLLELPVQYKPNKFSDGENDKKYTVLDHSIKTGFSESSNLFPYLSNDSCEYLFSDATIGSATLTCQVKLGTEFAEELFKLLCKSRPAFAYCCCPSERKFKNLFEVHLDKGKLEAWVGRDFRKYIPGLYWLTAISKKLFQAHSLQIEVLARSAVEPPFSDTHTWLFKFYLDPNEWSDSLNISKQMQIHRGIFDKRKLMRISPKMHNLIDANSFLTNWK